MKTDPGPLKILDHRNSTHWTETYAKDNLSNILKWKMAFLPLGSRWRRANLSVYSSVVYLVLTPHWQTSCLEGAGFVEISAEIPFYEHSVPDLRYSPQSSCQKLIGTWWILLGWKMALSLIGLPWKKPLSVCPSVPPHTILTSVDSLLSIQSPVHSGRFSFYSSGLMVKLTPTSRTSQ